MKTMTGSEVVKSLKKLPNMGELTVAGELWTKFSESQEFKVSPKGNQGDYDTDSHWVAYDELEDIFGTQLQISVS